MSRKSAGCGGFPNGAPKGEGNAAERGCFASTSQHSLKKKIVLKSSETYAKKILPSAFFEWEGGGDSADYYLGQGQDMQTPRPSEIAIFTVPP